MRWLLASLLVTLGCASPPPRSAGVASEPNGQLFGYALDAPAASAIEIERAPRVLYRGEWAYLVVGRWYYPTSRGWIVFRDEPEELRREREVTTEQSPTDATMPRGPETSQLSPLFSAPYPAR